LLSIGALAIGRSEFAARMAPRPAGAIRSSCGEPRT